MFLFDEALDLIDTYDQSHPPWSNMYSESRLPIVCLVSSRVLVALLSGARTARRSDLAKTLYDRMQRLFPNNRSVVIPASILLSNTYRSLGDYGQATDVRDHRLKTYGAKVEPGKTWTVVDGQVSVSISTFDRDVV